MKEKQNEQLISVSDNITVSKLPDKYLVTADSTDYIIDPVRKLQFIIFDMMSVRTGTARLAIYEKAIEELNDISYMIHSLREQINHEKKTTERIAYAQTNKQIPPDVRNILNKYGFKEMEELNEPMPDISKFKSEDLKTDDTDNSND